ncbi:MAG: hypothetical protein FJ011_12570 [Chloroflexi bacterium]|nr:hypothetical protein [Chloroflexota bacterium]
MILAATPEQVMWGLLIILVAGYLLGTWVNRRRSRQLGAWLQGGLKGLGGKVTWKWIRSMTSGAQALIVDANRPFRQIEIIYVLLTRELLPLWGVELLRGKRDTLIVRASLRSEPAEEIEVVPLHGPLRRTLDKAAGDQPWTWQEGPAGLGIATHGPANKPIVGRVRSFVDRYSSSLERLSLRRRQPNLILFLRLVGVERERFAELTRELRQALGGEA